MERVVITPAELAEQGGTTKHQVYEWASLDADPLNIYYPPGKQRGGQILVDEYAEWLKRNGERYSERKKVRR